MSCVFIILSVSNNSKCKKIFWEIRDDSKYFSGRFRDGGAKQLVLTPDTANGRMGETQRQNLRHYSLYCEATHWVNVYVIFCQAQMGYVQMADPEKKLIKKLIARSGDSCNKVYNGRMGICGVSKESGIITERCLFPAYNLSPVPT